MADFASTSNGIRKLNNHNYGYWETCIESYLQGQDLWEIVVGTDTIPPPAENAEALRKWKIKAGKSLYILKKTIEEDLLEHIRDAETPKAAWENLAKLFSKKNEARLQLLENELAGISKGNLSIAQYFTKVKSICREISQLAPEEKVSEARMKRIIIHGLRPEYNGFIAAVRGWPTQPSLVELENLLANQEELAKQMSGVVIKDEDEALFTSKKKGTPRRQDVAKEKKTQGSMYHPRGRSNTSGGARRGEEYYRQQNEENDRRQSDECFNCGKKGHFARNCRLPRRRTFQGNMATTKEENSGVMLEASINEEEWDTEAGFSVVMEQEELIEDMEESSPWKGKTKDAQGLRKPSSSKCFICDGDHWARQCPQRQALSLLLARYQEDNDVEGCQEGAHIGSLQLSNGIQSTPKIESKGLLFVDVTINGKATRAMVDTGASHNFISPEEATRLGVKVIGGKGSIKAVNSAAKPIHEIAQDVKTDVGTWSGRLNFSIVPMDDYKLILGIEFLDQVKAIPMPFANVMSITEGNQACVVPMIRGTKQESKALSALQLEEENTNRGSLEATMFALATCYKGKSRVQHRGAKRTRHHTDKKQRPPRFKEGSTHHGGKSKIRQSIPTIPRRPRDEGIAGLGGGGCHDPPPCPRLNQDKTTTMGHFRDKNASKKDLERSNMVYTPLGAVHDDREGTRSIQNRGGAAWDHGFQRVLEVSSTVQARPRPREFQTDPSEERDSSTSKDKSPWKTGMHWFTSEEFRSSQIEVDEPTQELRRSARKRRLPERYKDYETQNFSLLCLLAEKELPRFEKVMEEENVSILSKKERLGKGNQV
ncbi:hypothetical protein GQ457_16G027420 [Hibiscus cannabinus]